MDCMKEFQKWIQKLVFQNRWVDGNVSVNNSWDNLQQEMVLTKLCQIGVREKILLDELQKVISRETQLKLILWKDAAWWY